MTLDFFLRDDANLEAISTPTALMRLNQVLIKIISSEVIQNIVNQRILRIPESRWGWSLGFSGLGSRFFRKWKFQCACLLSSFATVHAQKLQPCCAKQSNQLRVKSMQYEIGRCVYFCFVCFAVYESPLWLTLRQGTIDTLSDHHLHAELHSAYNYDSRRL